MKLIKSGTISRSKIHHSKKYSKYSLKLSPVEENLIYDDLVANGQKNPVEIDENFDLLDGYLRDRLLGKQRIDEIKFQQWEFEDEAEKIIHILSLNRMRRHYSEYQKCQMAKPLYLEEKKKAEIRQKSGATLGPKDLKGTATSIAAKAAGTSGSTFKRFLDIEKSPELPKYEQDLIKGSKKIRTVSILVTRKDRNLRKHPLPKTISDVMLVDFPYQYDDQGGKGAADEHYDTIPTPQLIKDFRKVAAADNSIIFAWFSPSFQYSEIEEEYSGEADNGQIVKIKIKVPVYQDILAAAEFKVINEFTWDKEKIGVGSYNRNQHENLLIAIKGDMPVPAELFPSIIHELRTSHSRKPNLWPMIKKMYPKRNYAEFYAREKTPGVLCHGNQIKKKESKTKNLKKLTGETINLTFHFHNELSDYRAGPNISSGSQGGGSCERGTELSKITHEMIWLSENYLNRPIKVRINLNDFYTKPKKLITVEKYLKTHKQKKISTTKYATPPKKIKAILKKFNVIPEEVLVKIV